MEDTMITSIPGSAGLVGVDDLAETTASARLAALLLVAATIVTTFGTIGIVGATLASSL